MARAACRLSKHSSPDPKEAGHAGSLRLCRDPEVVMVQIMESPKTHKAKGGVLFSERKT